MAKCIKAKKTKLFALNRLMANIPEQKFEEGSLKIRNFFRAVKKVLRKELDALSDLEKEFRKLAEPYAPEERKLEAEISQLDPKKDQERIQKLRKQINDIEEKFQAIPEVKENIQKRVEVSEQFNSGEATVTFDNEDFNFVEELFIKNAKVLFKVNDKMDLDTMDDMMELFEAAFVPKDK